MTELEITLRADRDGRVHLDTKGITLSEEQHDLVMDELRRAVETKIRRVKSGTYTFATPLPNGAERHTFSYETVPNPEFPRFNTVAFKTVVADPPPRAGEGVWLRAVKDPPPEAEPAPATPTAKPVANTADNRVAGVIGSITVALIVLALLYLF